jgi:hypothetical protein
MHWLFQVKVQFQIKQGSWMDVQLVFLVNGGQRAKGRVAKTTVKSQLFARFMYKLSTQNAILDFFEIPQNLLLCL